VSECVRVIGIEIKEVTIRTASSVRNIVQYIYILFLGKADGVF
jgi:hypothetical protein